MQGRVTDEAAAQRARLRRGSSRRLGAKTRLPHTGVHDELHAAGGIQLRHFGEADVVADADAQAAHLRQWALMPTTFTAC